MTTATETDVHPGTPAGLSSGRRLTLALAVGAAILLFTVGRSWLAIGPLQAPADGVVEGRIWRGLDRDIEITTPGPGTLSVDVRSDTLLDGVALGAGGGRSPATTRGIGLQRFEIPVSGGTARLELGHAGTSPLARFEVRSRFRDAPASLAAGTLDELSLRPGAEDRLPLDIAATGWLRVHSRGDVDLAATLEDAAGTPLATDDDGGAAGNFALQARVAPGRYTLVVRGATADAGGRYALATQLADRQPLRIRATPASARIAILGSEEPFENGMLFAPGELTVSVSAPGYTAEMLRLEHTPFEPTIAEVVLRDDHGDDLATATLAAIGAFLEGGLGAGDLDLFEFAAPEAGDYRFESGGEVDTFGRLYDAQGVELASNDDGGEGFGFLLARSLAAGETVYVEVSAYGTGTGLYTLASRLVPPDDHVDGIGDAATLLTAGGGVTGRLTDGDRDVFRITVTDPVNLELSADGPMDTYGRLYDAAGNEIAVDDDGGTGSNFLIRATLREPGDVFLEVSGYGDDEVGEYLLSLRSSELLPDDHGDVLAEATPLTVDGSAAGMLEAGDLDLFRIEVDAPMGLEIRSDSALDTLGRLLDANGTELASNDDGGVDANFMLLANVTSPGSVYVEVTGYGGQETGAYAVLTRSLPLIEDDHGDTRTDATLLEAGATATGRLTSNDRDLFVFTASGPAEFEASAFSSFDTVGRLLDGSSEELAGDDDSGTDSNFLLRAEIPAAGDYYLEIRGYNESAIGDYRIETRLVTTP